jgi:hypothetical protein
MSWRETLGIIPAAQKSRAHNSHKAQKPVGAANCADIANSVYRNSKEDDSKLLEILADACHGFDITPAEVKEALTAEDIDDWGAGVLSNDTLAAFAHSLVQKREMSQGKRPDHYTEQATCERCGPIWLWFSGKVQGCPWCWNRAADRPIPRPVSVKCCDCLNFKRIDHPHLGHCTKGEPEAIAGLWDSTLRSCLRFEPARRGT